MDVVQAVVVALIGLAAAVYLLRGVLRRPTPRTGRKASGCGACSGCHSSGCSATNR